MTGPKRLPQPGADQRDAWRRALADRGKQQRNKRGRRPGPQITGIRVATDRPDRDAPST